MGRDVHETFLYPDAAYAVKALPFNQLVWRENFTWIFAGSLILSGAAQYLGLRPPQMAR
jgi:hypothetical protein